MGAAHPRAGAQHPSAGESELGWLVVEELSVRAAALLEPEFRRSGGRNGRLSVQTDPRFHRDAAALAERAVHFSTLAPNIIVKIPATRIGIEAIEAATYRGVSINATVSFTVAQAIAVAEAIERGFARREADGLPMHEFGSVCTIMGGRLDDWLKSWAAANRVLIDPGHFERAGVAALKKAHRIYRERGYRVRILSAAFRNALQWSELVGGDLVVSPPFDWQARINQNRIPVRPHAIATRSTPPSSRRCATGSRSSSRRTTRTGSRSRTSSGSARGCARCASSSTPTRSSTR